MPNSYDLVPENVRRATIRDYIRAAHASDRRVAEQLNRGYWRDAVGSRAHRDVCIVEALTALVRWVHVPSRAV